jgi:predicted PurR-regulated permease PerM
MSVNKLDVVERYKRAAIIAWAIVGIAVVIYIALFVLGKISVVIPLFVYTVALVYLLRPSVEYFSRKKIPRPLAVTLTYLIASLILLILIVYFVPVIYHQIVIFLKALRTQFIPAARQIFKTVSETYQSRFKGTPLDLRQGLIEAANKTKNANYANIAGNISGTTFSFFTGLLNIFLAPILAFFILKDLPAIKETIVNLVHEKRRLEVLEIVSKVNKVLAGFLKGQLIIAGFVFVFASIWFWILGLKFPLLLGIIAGVFNIVPYFGPIIGGGIAAIVALFGTANPLFRAMLVIVGMLVIQQVDSMLISPLVLKRQVNLHPVLIVFSLLIGGSLLGILGLILAVPVAAVAKVMVYHFIERSDGFSGP